MNILDEIVAHKRQELAAAQRARPLAEMQRAAQAAPPPRPFRAALEAGATDTWPAVIAEIKRRSPVKGAFADICDPASLAVTYVNAGAAALSVLTDARFFQGSLADLREARAAVDVPVLRKDFTLDLYDVWVARAAGADSVLLIAAILDPALLARLVATARALGMEPLVEVHTEAEMAQAREAGAQLIGVNNRDLQTFTVDLGVTERLAPLAPPGALVAGLSGVATAADAHRLRAAGAQAILVGEALVTAPDPAARLRELRGAEAHH